MHSKEIIIINIVDVKKSIKAFTTTILFKKVSFGNN